MNPSPTTWPLTLPLLLSLFVALLLSGCVEKQMSLEDAKQVSVTLNAETFVPPPRHIEDVLNILKQAGSFDSDITKAKEQQADASPPPNATSAALGHFYMQRGNAARHLGRTMQALEDLRQAYSYYDDIQNTDDKKKILLPLAQTEKDIGNIKKTIALIKKSINIKPSSSDYATLFNAYLAIGDQEAAEEAANQGIALTNRIIDRLSGKAVQNASKIANHQANLAAIQARLHTLKGEYKEGERMWRQHIDSAAVTLEKSPRRWVQAKIKLAKFLLLQDRLLEAEVEIRAAFKKAMGLGGKDSEHVLDALTTLAEIKLAQEQAPDAEKLIQHVLKAYEQFGISNDSERLAKTRGFLAKILVQTGAYQSAVAQYDLLKTALQENPYLFKTTCLKPDILLALMEIGRVDEAYEALSEQLQEARSPSAAMNHKIAIRQGLLGIAAFRKKNFQEAYAAFSSAIPILAKDRKPSRRIIFTAIVTSSIELLAEVNGTPMEKEFGVDAKAEAFALAELLRGESVQGAITAASARSAALVPELNDFVRKEQDATQQIDALNDTLSDALSLPPDQQDTALLEAVQAKISSLTQAREAFLKEIKKQFPKYFDLIRPHPPSIAQVQQSLAADEAMISILCSTDKTYIWAIPAQGTPLFAVANTGKAEIGRAVATIRRSLTPTISKLGDIPPFDLTTSSLLFSTLLQPVAAGWQHAANLVMIADGPLGPLPFALLPTSPVEKSSTNAILFEEYKEVPWLIRTATISRLPSAATFTVLRSMPSADTARKPFIGFGDPYFNTFQETLALQESRMPPHQMANRGAGIKVRGIGVTTQEEPESSEPPALQLENLARLPDTADEIIGIAHSLGADVNSDIFLGINASEEIIKQTNLTDRRVIAFATHALIPGDLDGLTQPALALSSPTITHTSEDGLLTMGEVLKLKLNADWVVLSACNTGAAAGEGAEALSGLGRAFFYAGTRAILASMWPVETTSAHLLTTGVFEQQAQESNLARAAALQRAMLQLIDSPGYLDQSTGKIAASYAHPLFWAPFILVGDGR